MSTETGTAEQQGDVTVVRFERRLAQPVERVWRALTDPSELINWWGDAEVDLVAGGRFVMRWLNTDGDGDGVVMHAAITELDPPRLLVTDGDKHGVLRWELSPDGEGTLLRFSSTLELPDGFRTKVLAGWHFHLDSLDETLAGGRPDLASLAGWHEIHELYGLPTE
jgi:uncharacterized protein YndB with AHSA1/START domain